MGDFVASIMNALFNKKTIGTIGKVMLLIFPGLFVCKYLFPVYINNILSAVSEIGLKYGLDKYSFLFPFLMVLLQINAILLSLIFVSIWFSSNTKRKKSEFSYRANRIDRNAINFYVWLIFWYFLLLEYGFIFNLVTIRDQTNASLPITIFWAISILVVWKLTPKLLTNTKFIDITLSLFEPKQGTSKEEIISQDKVIK